MIIGQGMTSDFLPWVKLYFTVFTAVSSLFVTVTVAAGTLLWNARQSRIDRHLNMKRDVFAEAAPAIYSMFLVLGSLININRPLPEISKEFQTEAPKVIKIQAFCGDATIIAALRLMASVSNLFIRLVVSRRQIEAKPDGERETTIDAHICVWVDGMSEIVRLWSDYLFEARKELGLDFDRAGFIAQMELQKAQTLNEMNNAFRVFKGEAG